MLAPAPVPAIDVIVGQNALLITGDLPSGCGLPRRSPLAAGGN